MRPYMHTCVHLLSLAPDVVITQELYILHSDNTMYRLSGLVAQCNAAYLDKLSFVCAKRIAITTLSGHHVHGCILGMARQP